jgi:hypothetical protein
MVWFNKDKSLRGLDGGGECKLNSAGWETEKESGAKDDDWLWSLLSKGKEEEELRKRIPSTLYRCLILLVSL